MRANAEQEAAIDELQKYGAVITNVEMGGKHPRIYYKYQDEEKFLVVAGTGSDWRGPENARRNARLSMGIIRTKRVGERRPRKKFHKDIFIKVPPTPAEPIQAKPNPYEEALKGTPLFQEVLAHRADRAWEKWFNQYLRSNGHTPAKHR